MLRLRPVRESIDRKRRIFSFGIFFIVFVLSRIELERTGHIWMWNIRWIASNNLHIGLRRTHRHVDNEPVYGLFGTTRKDGGLSVSEPLFAVFLGVVGFLEL